EGLGRMKMLRRQGVLEWTVEPGPRGHDARIFEPTADLVAFIQQNVVRGVDAERGPSLDPDPPQHAHERVMRAEPAAAACKVLAAALEHIDAPADRAQQMRCEQSAEGAADDQSTTVPRHDHPLSVARNLFPKT